MVCKEKIGKSGVYNAVLVKSDAIKVFFKDNWGLWDSRNDLLLDMYKGEVKIDEFNHIKGTLSSVLMNKNFINYIYIDTDIDQCAILDSNVMLEGYYLTIPNVVLMYEYIRDEEPYIMFTPWNVDSNTLVGRCNDNKGHDLFFEFHNVTDHDGYSLGHDIWLMLDEIK